ncbi:MAG TPA: hypothetical protein PLF71_00950 [bacterium]|nr:hypothetical protein [bacterium]
MEKKRKATKGQRERIVNMLNSGLIDSAEAQALIERHRDDLSARKQQDKKRLEAERLAFWEKGYPGKGKAVMKVLRPFYNWQPVLKPALPDLEDRVRTFDFWEGVKVYEFVTEVADASLKHTVWDSRWDLPFIHVEPFWYSEERRSLELALSPLLYTQLSALFGPSLAANALASLINTLTALLVGVYGDLRDGRIKGAAEFKPLLALWLAGNFPIASDSNDNLIVFVSAT